MFAHILFTLFVWEIVTFENMWLFNEGKLLFIRSLLRHNLFVNYLRFKRRLKWGIVNVFTLKFLQTILLHKQRPSLIETFFKIFLQLTVYERLVSFPKAIVLIYQVVIIWHILHRWLMYYLYYLYYQRHVTYCRHILLLWHKPLIIKEHQSHLLYSFVVYYNLTFNESKYFCRVIYNNVIK